MEYANDNHEVNAEFVYKKLLLVGYEFKSKTPKGTISSILGTLHKEGKLNREKKDNGFIYSLKKAHIIFSEIDPYGEEDWDN